MLWICTDAKINWDAISAVGTAGAAVTALVVWIYDLRSKAEARRAEAKFLATIIAPQVETLNVRLDSARFELWGPDGYVQEPGHTSLDQYFSGLVGSTTDLNNMLHQHLQQMDTARLDAHLEKLTSLPPPVVDQLSLMLGHISTAKAVAQEILDMPVTETERKVANLHDYYSAISGACMASASASKFLTNIAVQRF